MVEDNLSEQVHLYPFSEEEDDDTFEKDYEDDEEEATISSGFVCEDCDYRWEITHSSNIEEDLVEKAGYCPMCGSVNVAQI